MLTMRTFAILFVCACGHPPMARPAEDPARKVTHAECVAAVDHAIALLGAGDEGERGAAAMMKGDTAGHVAQCEQTATLADHRCLMAARTATELGLCPMPGSAR